MKNEAKILIQLTRIEDKLDAHLSDHKKKFDILTRVVIPGTSMLVSIGVAAVTHLFNLHPKH